MHIDAVPVEDYNPAWKWTEGLISPGMLCPAEWAMPKLEQDVYYKIWFKDKSSQSVQKAVSIILDKGIPALQAAGIE